MDEATKTLIHAEAGEQEIEDALRVDSPSIRSDGLRKVVEGVTTMEEVMRVTEEM